MDSKAILDLFYVKKEGGEKDSRNEKNFKTGKKFRTPSFFLCKLNAGKIVTSLGS